SYRDLGICSFITGPRTDLAAGQFLLTMGDAHSPDTAELQLTGTYTAVDTDSDGDQAFTLSPDTAAAAQYFEGVLRTQLADNTAVFQLDHLSAKVRQAPRKDLLCHVSLTGSVSGLGRPSTTVSVSFRGQGQYFPGDT